MPMNFSPGKTRTDDIDEDEIDEAMDITWTGDHTHNNLVDLESGAGFKGDAIFDGSSIKLGTQGQQMYILNTPDSHAFAATADEGGNARDISFVHKGDDVLTLTQEVTLNKPLTTNGNVIRGGEGIANVEINDTAKITGGINLSNSSSIQDAGTDAIQFDGSRNVKIPNGDLNISGNKLKNVGGTADANTGDIRFGKQSSVFARDSGNNNDIRIWNIDSNDNMQFGNANASIIQITPGSRTDIKNGNLRMDTGQAIEDGGGDARIAIESSYTGLQGNSGTLGYLVDDNNNRIRAIVPSTYSWQIFDDEQSSVGVQYDTDKSEGVLRTPGAGITVQSNIGTGYKEGLNFVYDGSGLSAIANHDSNNITTDVKISNGLVDLSNNATDLRLAEGQAIEDGSGTTRIDIISGGTSIYGQQGTVGFTTRNQENGGYMRKAGDGKLLYDDNGSFEGLRWLTGTSTGTLELTNADMDASGQTVTAGTVSTDDQTINLDGSDNSTDDVLSLPSSNAPDQTDRDRITLNVGTSAKLIMQGTNNGNNMNLVLVSGVNESTDPSEQFWDVVQFQRWGSPSVVNSFDANSAAGRTYTRNGTDLELAMGSAEYDVRARSIENGGPI